ncbi:MAG TPA: hypothetical protein VMU50_02690 [Polyangia bacterium]|nr:hypothetical protein [Polyangia bacterium]
MALLALSVGCAHQISYVPVGPAATGGPAARYPIPPEAPQGEVWVTSFGFTDMDLGPGQPGHVLHARLAVSNGSAAPWNVDGRQQSLVGPGLSPQAPSFLNTDAAGGGPVYQVPPGRASVFDFYYALPPPLNDGRNLADFALDWNVDAGGRAFAEQTPFARYDGPPPGYATYPPYVVVGLGFSVGWWYGPRFVYLHHAHYPIIRGYYHGPVHARAGAWRGAPAGAWRGTPPAAGWRGTPPATTTHSNAPRGGGHVGGHGGGSHGHGR